MGKVVTAPSAADSREILQRLALQPAASRSLDSIPLMSPAVSPNNGESIRDGGNDNQSPSPTGGGNKQSTDVNIEDRSSFAATNATAAAGSPKSGVQAGFAPANIKKKPPVIISDQDTRTQLREMRSPPRGKWTVNVTAAKQRAGVGATGVASHGGVRDFRAWNPASVDDPIVQGGP